MSLLRQRATEVSVESTLSAFNPAAARLRLVRVTRSFSDEELKEPLSHARAADGWARLTTDVSAKRSAMTAAVRRAVGTGRVRDMSGGGLVGPVRWGGGVGSGVVVTVGVGCGRVCNAMVPARTGPGY